ncbi:MAG TPA: DUF21 domain-containing protein [Planctomycetes bacterium]|nr:DUF21 domain-containing protein [Planctomycetota bacterium]
MSSVGIALTVLYFALSAIFSGSETGVYSVSHVRLDAEARQGRSTARILRFLLRGNATLLITLLVGNNLMIELLTHQSEALVPAGMPPWAHEMILTLVLTPLVFFLAELAPKDLFRRRPYRMLGFASPILLLAYIVFLPVVLPMRALAALLERLLGLPASDVSRLFRRREMLDILEEGTRTGVIPPEARALARNVLVLRETPLERVMVPWDRVRRIDLEGQGPDGVREAVGAADFTRLPVIGEQGGRKRVLGYIHQLDVLGSNQEVGEALRPIVHLSPETPVDRALHRLRDEGQRLALVGTPEEPVGLVTLSDLVGEIARESRSRETGELSELGRNSVPSLG